MGLKRFLRWGPSSDELEIDNPASPDPDQDRDRAKPDETATLPKIEDPSFH